MCFDDGVVAAGLVAGTVPAAPQVHDAFGFASGVLHLSCPPKRRAASTTSSPVSTDAARTANVGPPSIGRRALPPRSGRPTAGRADAIRRTHRDDAYFGNALRAGAAARSAPLHPLLDSRRSDDGRGVLRMGHAREVREFIDWYAPHQRADGFVPCCVDAEGVDWLVEHDSHGELIALIADYHRFSADSAFIAESWMYIERAVACIERIDRRARLAAEVRQP